MQELHEVYEEHSGHGLPVPGGRNHASHWPKESAMVYSPKSKQDDVEGHQPHKKADIVGSLARQLLQEVRV